MSAVRITHVGGPTVLIEAAGWRLLTDPTFDPPGKRYSFGWGTSSRKLAGPAVDSSASWTKVTPASRNRDCSSRTSVKGSRGCAAWSQPGLKVRMLPSNIPWKSPITVTPFLRISHPWAWLPPSVVKPRVS